MRQKVRDSEVSNFSFLVIGIVLCVYISLSFMPEKKRIAAER